MLEFWTLIAGACARGEAAAGARHAKMVPARNLPRERGDGYGGGCSYGVDIHRKGFCQRGFSVSSGPAAMAEDDSRSGCGGSDDEEAGGSGEGRGDGRGEVGTSSKGGDDERDDSGWLRLSIGGSGGAAGYSGPGGAPLKAEAVRGDTGRPRRVGEMLELDLFRERPPDSRPVPRPAMAVSSLGAPGVSAAAPAAAPFLTQHQHAAGSGLLTGYPPYASPDVTTWSFWSSQASTSSTVPVPYNSRLFVYTAPPGSSGPSAEPESSATPSGMRVVSPPSSRPNTGVWFVLQASQNQVREPFLSQIPKCYLRIKDGRMTIRLLKKYLVKKLGLDTESEVEITCRGQQLHPSLTLQHVRDNIWRPRDVAPPLPESPGGHVMTLHYGRSA